MTDLPKTAAFELTYRCNHRCLFCSCPWETDHHARMGEMGTDECMKVLDAVAKRGVETVSFTGGEPLLRDDLFDIMGHAADLGMGLALVTNGRLLDEGKLERLHSMSVSLGISVPGISTYRELTGVDGLDHVLSMFRVARDLGMEPTANIAVTKLNLPELYENVAYPLINGAEHVLLNRFMLGGRGLDHRDLALSPEEVNCMLEVAEEVLAKAGKYGHVGTELPRCIIREPDRYVHLQVSTMCGAAKSFFDIDPSGWVKTCNHSERRIVHYSEIDKLDADAYWTSFRNRNYRPVMCDGCNEAGCCDGGCREAAAICGGSIYAADPCFAV